MSDIADRLSRALSDRYRIERELGQGGMATVYLAHDLKHDRQVALKVLRPELAAVIGAERFLSEIKTTANLQHPHILPLFDSGTVEGTVFYVMPFVAGETLRDRLTREKQLSLDDAIRITREVASALDYAHRHGVIHRDIKPENILLHDGQALVADFGIALAASSAGGSRMTETGMSLGTPHYMSPEQAMGEREITARSDVYALGCVAYEMLTGDPPFTGSTAQAIVAQVITEDPRPPSARRKTIPPAVEEAVLTALAKLPADRFETAKAFADALAGEGQRARGPAGRRTTTAHRHRALGPSGLPAILATVLLLTAGFAAWGWMREVPAPVTRHEVVLGPALAEERSLPLTVAIAPDESGLVFSDSGEGRRQLFWKPRDALTARPIPGTEGGTAPFFSPDGTWIGFFAEYRLKKVAVEGGAAVTLAEGARLSNNPFTGAGAWSDDGWIYFVDASVGLSRIPEGGGTAEAIYRLGGDQAGSAVGHISLLPRGRGVLFDLCSILCVTSSAWVMDARTGESRELIPGASMVTHAPTGHLIYATETGDLLAAPFDLDALTVGDPLPVLDGVRRGDFILGGRGTLLYVLRSSAGPATLGEPVWLDRAGQAEPVEAGFLFPLPNPPGLALSPDGSRLALGVQGTQGINIWIKELGRANAPFSRLTFGSNDVLPRWSPDGREILFTRAEGVSALYAQRADGLGAEQQLARAEKAVSEGLYSPDRRWLLLRVGRGTDRVRDILALRPGTDSAPVPLLAEPFDEISPAFSPDGRWLAYASNESGRYEVYVRPFPDVSTGRWQISAGGGVDPRWSPRSGELFYLSPTSLMVVQVATTPAFAIRGEEALFPLPAGVLRGSNYALYDVAPDGRRVLVLRRIASVSGAPSARLILVQHWLEELRQRVRP